MDDLKLLGTSKEQLYSLEKVVRIFSQDLRMSFGLDKCAVLEMRRGREVDSSERKKSDDQGKWKGKVTSTLVSDS